MAQHELSHAWVFHHLLCAPPASADPSRTALVLLNTPATAPDVTRALWGAASFRVAADGAAMRLRAAMGDDAGAYLPDALCGDMDSCDAETRFVMGLVAASAAMGARVGPPSFAVAPSRHSPAITHR
jgi:hypothetical protein